MGTNNKFYSIVLASIACFLSLILTSSMTSASFPTDYSAEIRGPVYNASDIDNVIDILGNGEAVTIDATQFAGFYYDHNNNVATESFSIKDVEGTQGNVIGEHGLVYQTTIQNTNYKFEAWKTYPIIGLFGEPYVPLKPTDASKIAKLVLDDNETYTLNIGDSLDLGQGYTLEVKQTDIDGENTWLEFDKDGQYVDDEIIETDGEGTWTCKLDDIQGENGVTVLKVHVKQVFQNAANNTTMIDGLWLIDYANSINIPDELDKLNNASVDGKVISENDLKYNTTIKTADYNYSDSAEGWDEYPVIYLFGEKYVPLKPTDASKLANLVLDSNETYTINTGDLINLGQGYTLKVKRVDIDGEKVWFEFDKDGQYVDDGIVSIYYELYNTWTVELDGIQGENDIDVLKVHVKYFPQGSINGVVKINGLWLIDYANAVDIYSSNEFGKLNDVSINGSTLSISNKYAFTLTRNSEQEIAKEIYFKVADISMNELRFYIFKQLIEPGTYEVRGQVAKGSNDFTWDARNFAGFYYDLDNNIITESLSVSGVNGNLIPENGLEYKTTIKKVVYKYENVYSGWDSYPVIGLFGEPYVPLNSTDASKLCKLILDSNDEYILSNGDMLSLGQGYSLKVKQIDVDGDKIWLEFDKDGQYVDDRVVSVDGGGENTWTCKLDNIQGEKNVTVLKVHVKRVFQGDVNSTTIDGLWLIDYANPMSIQSSDEFGKLNDIFINGITLSISNRDVFTLTRGSDQEIGQGIYFKVANTSVAELRYYPFVKRIIGESNSKTLPVPEFSTNVTSGYAPLAVQFTDLSQNSIGRLWDFNNDWQGDSAEAAPIYVFANNGSYNVNLIAVNENGTASKTAVINVLTPSSSSGGSSGGSSEGSSHSSSGSSSSSGSTGSSPEPQSNVQVKEISQAFVASGKTVKFDFPKNATCVVYVSFDAKKTFGKATTVAEQLKGKSTLVSGSPLGEVYKFFNVWVGNGGIATSKNIENSVVCFKVEKSWVKDKNINPDSITFNRYNDKKWEQFPVSLSGEDNKFQYFTAKTSGFSSFAITGTVKPSEEAVTKIEVDYPETINKNNTENKEPQAEQKEILKTTGFEIYYGVASLLAVLLYKRK